MRRLRIHACHKMRRRIHTWTKDVENKEVEEKRKRGQREKEQKGAEGEDAKVTRDQQDRKQVL